MALTRLVVAGSTAFCCYLAGTEIVNRLQDSLVLTDDPIDSTLSLAAEGRWAEVKMMSEFIAERPDLGDPEQAATLAAQADEELNGFWGQTKSFAQGAVTGEPTDLASMLGSLSLDLFVIGDIRDLAVQGWREASDGTGDGLIIALSAIGLTTTLAPQIDWAPALTKTLKRTGALTGRFTKSLTRTGAEAIETGNYGRLKAVLTDMGKTTQRLGPGPLRGVMSSVDTTADLAKISKAADIDPRGTYVITRLFGKEGVKWISHDGKNVGVLVASIKTGSRLAKTVQKSTRTVPTSWLTLVFAVSALVLIAAVYPRRRRGRPRYIPYAERTGSRPPQTLNR